MKPKFALFAYVAIFLIALSGFQFGYHMALTGPFLLFITEKFRFTLFDNSLISSFIVLGALLGSFLVGPLADRVGRKKSLLICSAITLLAGAVTMMGSSCMEFCIGRFLAGIGIGAISSVSSMLLSEISPESIRGQVVSINQLMITVGSLVAFLVGYAVSESKDWHSLILFSAFPAIAQIFFSSRIPESPAWHKTRNFHEKAEETLLMLRKDSLWKSDFSPKDNPLPTVKGSGFKKALWIGIFVNFFQQITGINAIIFFAPQLFQSAGFTGDSASLLASLSLGAVNTISTILAVVLVERLGRKLLLLIGSSLIALSMLGLSLVYYIETPYTPILSVVCLLLFCFSFSVSLGPITWVLISEIFHPKSRGKAMGICLFVNWLTCYLVTFFFLDLCKIVGEGGVFAIFGGFAVAAYYYFYKKLPETKGKTHEEISAIMEKSQALRQDP